MTILFADVVGSTMIGETLDPEAVRGLMQAWFTSARSVIERHGGTVEKFIGDAVMAVFGVPVAHEDDALRAIRAAAELAAAERGALEIRVAIDTGEVVVGDAAGGASFVTGDAVNTAARLQAAADPGEVLLGAATYRSARTAITAHPLAPLALKGKREPVVAYRLVSVDASSDAITRRIDTPMVGRDAELASLRAAFERAVADHAPEIAIIVGPPGIGKSRLVHELVSVARSSGARVLRGRCLPYGAGITYRPVAELVHGAAGIGADDPREVAQAKIMRLVADAEHGELVGRRVASLVGLLDESAPVEETTWAVRRMLEHLAREAPLVVAIDDLQWAEPGMLELVAHVADLARDVPLLLVLVARPELAESHPEWTGRPGATLVLLDTLPDAAAVRLVDDLFPGHSLETAVRERITTLAEGNPLYLEQYTAMLVDEGWLVDTDGHLVAGRPLADLPTPASVGALLAARLDRLPEPERRTAERASVVGRTFWWGAVRELSPERERPMVGGNITSLVRRDLLLPDSSEFAGDEAYRFRHLLVRDAAYAGLSKADRADLHERFATWLEARATDRLEEYEEILGFHLAAALEYRTDLTPHDPRVPSLRRRAVEHYLAAGRRSLDAGDAATAAALLGRADTLLESDDPLRHEIAGDLAVTLAIAGRIDACRAVMQEETARLPGADPRTSRAVEPALALARIVASQVPSLGQSDGDRMVRDLASDGNELALAYAWHAISLDRWFRYRIADAEVARGKAIEHAQGAGARRLEDLVLYWGARFYGPMPIEDGIADAESELAAAGGHRIRRAAILVDLACLRAVSGDVDVAREALDEAMGILRDLGQWLYVSATAEFGAMVERFGGDAGRGYESVSTGIDAWLSIDAAGYAATLAGTKSLMAALAARWSELEAALASFDAAAAASGHNDPMGIAFTERARAMRVAASDLPLAIAHTERAVAALEPTDWRIEQTDALLDLATYLVPAGRPAREVARRALALAEAKGYRRGVERAQAILAEAPA